MNPVVRLLRSHGLPLERSPRRARSHDDVPGILHVESDPQSAPVRRASSPSTRSNAPSRRSPIVITPCPSAET